MQANELDKILVELYQFEPGLRDFEAELKNVIRQMSDLRPDTHFTPDLAARIKMELMQHLSATSSSKKIFTFNIMNKKILMAASAVFGVAIIALLINLTMPLSQDNSAGKTFNQSVKDGSNSSLVENTGEGVTRLAAKAFGSLALSSQLNTSQVASNESVTLDSGSAAAMDSAISTPSSGTASSPARAFGLGGGGGVNASTKMIAPWYQVKYVYTGDQLTLEDKQSAVYKRLIGGLESNSSLLSLVKNLNFSDIDMSSFENLKVSNLSLMENKDKGLALNFDFVNDNIYISENWQKWLIPERDACGGDNACWEKFRIKEKDVLADSDLIAISDKFISDHEISLNHYGLPQVDNNWRQDYELSADKNNYYIPEYISVVYPLMIDEKVVLDQSGNPYGLRVNISLLQKTAAGLNGLSPYRYQSSDYALETDFSRIVKMAETGRQAGIYYDGLNNGEVQEIELGTPTRAYVQYWRYLNNSQEELLIPALVFPVLTKNNQAFYGQRSVVVPLVKELLDELEANQPPIPMPYDKEELPMPISLPTDLEEMPIVTEEVLMIR